MKLNKLLRVINRETMYNIIVVDDNHNIITEVQWSYQLPAPEYKVLDVKAVEEAKLQIIVREIFK